MFIYPLWAPQCLTLLVMIIYSICNTIVPKVRNQNFIFIKQSYIFSLRIWNSKSLNLSLDLPICVVSRRVDCLVLWVKFKRHWSSLLMNNINLMSWIRSNNEVRRKEIETKMPCWEIKRTNLRPLWSPVLWSVFGLDWGGSKRRKIEDYRLHGIDYRLKPF
jgi:hypothetical protein